MAVFNDQIITSFDILVERGVEKLDMLNSKLNVLFSTINKVRQHIKMSSELAELGLNMRNNGVFVDVASGKVLKYSEALSLAAKRTRELMLAENQRKNLQAAYKDKGMAAFGIDNLSTKTDNNLLKGGAQNILDAVGKDMKKSALQGQNALEKLGTTINNSTEDMAKMELQAKNMARIGPMFAFLFGGMQLQRIGLSITRFVLPAMDKVENYTSRGTRQVNAMKAAFEFLKFSMFETFTQTPLFQKFVDLIITATNWLSTMVAKHPMLVQVAGTVGAIATVLGTMAIGAGIFNQFAMMASYLGVNGSILAGVKATSAALLKSPWTWAIASALAFGFVVAKAYDEFPELKAIGNEALDSIKDNLMLTVSNFMELFGITIDTTDSLYFLGSAFNLVAVSAATGFNTALSAINLVIDALKIAGQYAALGVVNIKGFFNAANIFQSGTQREDTAMELDRQAEKIKKTIEESYSSAAETQIRLYESNENLNDAFNKSWIGMTQGRAAALRYNSGLKDLNDTVITQVSEAWNLKYVDDELIKTSEELVNSFMSEKSSVDSLTSSYERLARAKSSAGGGGSSGGSQVFYGKDAMRQSRDTFNAHVSSVTGGLG